MTEEQKRIEVIEQSLPAIVSISVSKNIDELSAKKPTRVFPVFERAKQESDNLADRIDGDQLDFGGGSGFLVDASGIVVTNIHVIKQKSLRYDITLHNGTTHLATLIDTDPVHDVAYLRMNSAGPFHALPLGDSAEVKVGQTVYAIGNVLGVFPETISRGIVSGLGRAIEAHSEDRKETLRALIQTDAAINPGNSGGPLIDSEGRVIGVNAANVSQAENIGFAVPINAIKNDIEDIKRYGKIKRAYLGVRHIILTPAIARGMNYPVTQGILVTSPSDKQLAVIPKSPADKAGLRENDIIISINETPLTEQYTLEDFLEDAEGGSEAKIKIMRNGKEVELIATLLERPTA
jgi:S1-C subfamily serine protease